MAGLGSAAGHQKSLDRLVEHDLVIAEPVNRGFIYRLNRDHVLMPALLAALEARDLTLRCVTPLPPELRYVSVAALGIGVSFGLAAVLLRLPGVSRVL